MLGAWLNVATENSFTVNMNYNNNQSSMLSLRSCRAPVLGPEVLSPILPPPPPQVEVKPYVLDDQVCDECRGLHCSGRYAPYFCGNIHCLRYYCEHCWASVHSAPGTQNHRCFIKENGDRPRAINFFPSQPRVTLP